MRARTYFHGAVVVKPSATAVVPLRVIVPNGVTFQFTLSFEQSMIIVAVIAPVPLIIPWNDVYGEGLNALPPVATPVNGVTVGSMSVTTPLLIQTFPLITSPKSKGANPLYC